MQIQQVNGPVTSVGAAAEGSQFQIAMNPKAFRVLSDTMYQDKISSIVREISCNAYDAHVAAGKADTPFILHLPDTFEPWVSFRDFGPGLSPEAVQTVFCVYFASTKDQSNDAVGAFGLGAKTPFSYTDQFNVTSIVKGRKYMYSAFIGGEGLPQIQLMAETDTDEPDGVEIKIGVEPSDFRAFRDAAKVQLRFFPVKPTIVNLEGFTFEAEPEYLFESNSIKVFKSQVYGRANIHVVQGPVGYPMDVATVLNFLPREDAEFLRVINAIGANFYFDIGEIGVTASREAMEYKGVTNTSIKARVASARKEITDWLTEQMETLPNVYEKVKFVKDNQEFRSLISSLTLDLTPATKLHNGTYAFSIGNDPKLFMQDVNRINAVGDEVTMRIKRFAINRYSNTGMNGFHTSRNSTDDALIVPKTGAKVAIALRDIGNRSRPHAKLRHFFKNNGLETMYVLTPQGDEVQFEEDFVEKLAETLGGFAEIFRVSEMEDAPRATYERNRTDWSRPTAYLCTNGDMDSVTNWTRVYDKLDELLDDNGDEVQRAAYVRVERQRIEGMTYDMKKLFTELSTADMIDLPIYGIREKDIAKLESSDIEWVKLEDYIKIKRDEVIANPEIRRYSIAENIRSTIQNGLGNRFSELKDLPKRAMLSRLMQMQRKAQDTLAASHVNSAMLRIAGYEADNHPAVLATRNEVKNVFAKTPMLHFASRTGWGAITGEDAKMVAEYIKMCHNC